MLTTRAKVALAAVISRVLVATRRLARLGPTAEVSRRGISWQLDLHEGIDLAIYLGVYERWLARIARGYLHEGDVAVDIGANIGVHTLMFASIVGPSGRVLAFEPTQFAYEKLQGNLALNPELADRVVAYQVFLNDGTDESVPRSVFSSWPVSSTADDIDPMLMGRKMPTEGAVATSLDNLLDSLKVSGRALTQLDFVKLDVDGNELSVLAGASSTIDEYKPVLLIEFAPYLQAEPDQWARSWIAFCEQHRYELWDPKRKSLVEMSLERLATISQPGASVDLVARPVSEVLIH